MVKNPAISMAKGNTLWCTLKYEVTIDDKPTTSASMIIIHSTHGLAKNSNPKSGKLVKKMGTAAQCIAHRVDAVMPMLSHLTAFLEGIIVQIYK